MPHDSISHWISQVAGIEIDVPLPRSTDDLVAARADPSFKALNVDLPQLAALHEVSLRGAAGRELTAEIHVPQGDGPFPILLFLHGGGWYTGGAEDERKLAMQLAEPGTIVVSLDYALAPEVPFPGAIEDCVYAARWIVREGESYGGDPRRLLIGGTSAGANLAAATIGHLHGGDGDGEVDGAELAGTPVRFGGAVLLFGVYDIPSYVAAPGSFAGWAEMMLTAYLGVTWTTRMRDPLVSPILGSLAEFPPCYLSCGDEDSMLPQSLALCRALTAADVPTTLSVVEGADHCFLNIPGVIAGAGPELDRIARWIGRRTDVLAGQHGDGRSLRW